MPTSTHPLRPPLTREVVLRTAIALADRRGLAGLSMRRLGQELHVEAMSLYNHVASKDDLLDAITDLVVAEIDLPGRDGDWRSQVRRTATSTHMVLRRHPWACTLWTRQGPGPAHLRYMEASFACLRHGGFGVEATYLAYHALDIYVVGFTNQQLSYPFEADEIGQVASDFLAQLATDDYPYIAEHVRQHLDGSVHEDDFEFGLDLILDGLSRMRGGD